MLRRWGLTKTVYFYFGRFLEKCLRLDGTFSLVFLRPLSRDDEFRLPHPYEFKVLSKEEVLAFTHDNPDLELSTERICKSFSRGDICVGVLAEKNWSRIYGEDFQ